MGPRWSRRENMQKCTQNEMKKCHRVRYPHEKALVQLFKEEREKYPNFLLPAPEAKSKAPDWGIKSTLA
jgi:hypothetical protein